MPEVIRIEDTDVLVDTSEYKYANWEFDKFNPVQSALMQTYETDANVAIAAATSAGKTVCSEMYLAHGIRKHKGKGIYVGPLKALASEKEQDWTDKGHHFNDLTTAIITGDYRFTGRRIKELDQADLIVMTPEMLASRCRNNTSDKSKFLYDVNTVVFDECFAEDTLVLTDQGPLEIGSIIDQAKDVKVASYDHDTGEVSYKSIVNYQKKLIKKKWVTLYYNGGQVQVTEDQLIWTSCGYKPAKDLCSGNIVEVVVGGEEQDRFNREREECNTRNDVGGWISTTDRSKQNIGSVKVQSIFETSSICRVEIQRIEKIGSHPATDITKRRLRKFCQEIYDSFLPRSEGNISQSVSEWKADCKFRMAEYDLSPNFFGCLVHGRWKPRTEFIFDTLRRIFQEGESNFESVAEEEMECGCKVDALSNISPSGFHSEGKGQVSKSDKRLCDSRNELQVASRKFEIDLRFLWEVVRAHEKKQINVQEMPMLWRKGLFAWATKVLSRLEEESICCDIEVSDNNNFFVAEKRSRSFVLSHNSHLLTVPKRGDHIEVALMKLVDINPDIRVVLLSATMPNVDEICGWICKITGRDTHFLESTYRPCPLNIHYESYYDGDKMYDNKEAEKVTTACGIVDYYPDDKFLVFVHTKRTGHLMVKGLQSCGINAEFHNAELTKEKRKKLEDKFKDDKSFRVIVATSTLAWGLNLPARRVVVTGIHRGLTAVENYDIQQMIGRAGRPKYDPVGDAYILVPESEKNTWVAALKKKSVIKSTLLDYVGTEENPHYKTLAFHVVSEIHKGNIKTKEQFHLWFKKSLAHYQDHAFDDKIVDKTLKMLEQYRSIKQENGEYKCTSLGTIASMFYFSPFDVSDLRRNFHGLFQHNKEGDDFAVSMCMGNIDTFKWNIANKIEKTEMAAYERKIESMFGVARYHKGAIKMGFAHYLMMKGKHNVPAFAPIQGMLKVDLERTMQVIGAIESMASNWDKKEWLKTLKMRLQYGVPADMVELCQIPNVGTVRANRLKGKGINKLEDFTSYDVKDLMSFMKCSKKLAEESLEGAKLIELKNSL